MIEAADLRDKVGASQIEAYQRDGAVVIRGLLAPHWIEALRDVFDALKADAADLTDYYSDHKDGSRNETARSSLLKDDVWMHNATIRRFLFESPISEAAARVMESPSARIYEDLLIYKAAGSDTSTPWHQDEPQWPLTGRQMSSVWLSLESTTRDTGALRFVAGTHRGPLHIPYVPKPLRERVDKDMHYFTGGPVPDIDADPERYRVMCFDTEPGDVIIFHPRAIHGAFGSAAARPRRTFSIRFLGEDVRWQPKASVFHDWLKDIHLKPGDRISGERFPEIWSAKVPA